MRIKEISIDLVFSDLEELNTKGTKDHPICKHCDCVENTQFDYDPCTGISDDVCSYCEWKSEADTIDIVIG